MAEIDREKVVKDLDECLRASCRGFRPRLSCPYNDDEWDIMRDAFTLLKEQEKIKSQEEFSKIIHGMFDHLWDCEIEHPVFHDTVGDLMNAVIQAYGQAVKWDG